MTVPTRQNMMDHLDEGVFHYFDCSTAHITPETNDKLTESVGSPDVPWFHSIHEYGFWLNADAADDEESLGKMPTDLQDIIRKAYSFGCSWVKLDADGFEHRDLSNYEEQYK